MNRGSKTFLTVLAIAYSWLVIWSHDYVQEPALFMQGKMGMFAWHFGILGLVGAGTIGLVLLIRHSPGVMRAISVNRYPVVVLLLAALTTGGTLMVNSVEHIHYLQYAILVLLIVPATGSVFPAVMIAVLVGIADEWYQYDFLHEWQAYLDFNDVVLNTIGAVLGGLISKISLDCSHGSIGRAHSWFRHPVAWTLIWIGLFLVVATLFGVGILGPWAETGMFTLHKSVRPEHIAFRPRWINTGWGNHWFQLEYWEAIGIVFVLPGALLLPGYHPDKGEPS